MRPRTDLAVAIVSLGLPVRKVDPLVVEPVVCPLAVWSQVIRKTGD